MNLSNKKLKEEDVKDILESVGFELNHGSIYWSYDQEIEVEVKLSGNKLCNLIHWINNFYIGYARESGKLAGRNEVRQDIKKILGI